MAGLTRLDKNALQLFKQQLQQEFAGHVDTLHLFGSKARGDAAKHSDVDVLVVLGPGLGTMDTRRQVSRITSRILLDTGVLISPKVFSREQYQQLRAWGEPLLINIEKDGIAL